MSVSTPAAPVALRPRDAAALVLIDRAGPVPRVLLGRRAAGHAFMPDLYVFPGGRRDAGDHRLPFADDLPAPVVEKLLIGNRRPMQTAAARALALAAIRELAEETGLVFASRAESLDERLRDAPPGAPSLACLRYVARAITPPGQPRRYDTRFFLAFADEAGIDPGAIRDSVELLDLQWVDMNAVSCLNMPEITKTVLAEVIDRMKVDASLGPGGDVPFYLLRRGQFVRHML